MPSPLVVLVDLPDASRDRLVEAMAACWPREQTRVFDGAAQAADFLLGGGIRPARAPDEAPVHLVLVGRQPAGEADALVRRLRGSEDARLLPLVRLAEPGEAVDSHAGASSVLRRPAEGPQAADIVARVLRYWLELNVAPPPPRGGYAT